MRRTLASRNVWRSTLQSDNLKKPIQQEVQDISLIITRRLSEPDPINSESFTHTVGKSRDGG